MATTDETLRLALENHRAGRWQAAEQLYAQILAADPNHAEALQLLGVMALQFGRLEFAADCIRRAIAVNGTVPGYHHNLGVALKAMGKLDEAIACYLRVLELQPDSTEAFNNLGNALKDKGRLEEATNCYRRALALQPNFPEALNNLGEALRIDGKAAQAEEYYRKALALRADYSEAHNNLANALLDLGKIDDAIIRYRRALELKPDYVEAHYNLANVHAAQGRPDEAVACYRRALELNPDYAQAYTNLGNVLMDQGKLGEALASHRRALELNPNLIEAADNLLFALHFSPDHDPSAIHAEHQQWNQRYGAPLATNVQPHGNDRSPERRLRIGYVSPDFRDHVVGRNLLPLFREHDHSKFEVICYASVRQRDEVTERLQSYADKWRHALNLTDEMLANLIREDRIDILVDLTLHMAYNRLLLFARKPAPVQVTFAGYPSTTGLTTIDYRLTDPNLDPPGLDDENYSEQSIRLPDSFWCYEPIPTELLVGTLPALERNHVTFGCLNNFSKVNASVLQLWADVLNQTPRSRMVIQASEGSHRQHTLELLNERGVAPDRVTFVTFRPRPQYLALYQDIDIALDTVPYNGHTTSLDAYWMGVPVVTLIGRTAVGRAGSSQLRNLGLEELIAKTPEEYVRIALGLAGDLQKLSQLRTTLRDRMRDSPLMDARRFARGIESAYREMWRRWCSP